LPVVAGPLMAAERPVDVLGERLVGLPAAAARGGGEGGLVDAGLGARGGGGLGGVVDGAGRARGGGARVGGVGVPVAGETAALRMMSARWGFGARGRNVQIRPGSHWRGGRRTGSRDMESRRVAGAALSLGGIGKEARDRYPTYHCGRVSRDADSALDFTPGVAARSRRLGS